MSDWRLNGQEKYLQNAKLYKITFPEFWEVAYREKNEFYQKIEQYAKSYVESSNKGHEYLEGEKIQHFWHEHCEFCWEKAMTDIPCTFYCTEDMKYWICEECFNDFKEQFNLQDIEHLMKYFIFEKNREGSCYHEFYKGEWDGKTFWKSDSLLLSDDILVNSTGFVDAIIEVVPDYDCYGETKISIDEWKKIGEIIANKDKVSQEIYNELNDWLITVFKKYRCFTILGI